MNPLISLVIPVYNVEKYLDKCMESVLAQTYDNFEVILVDDGSTDNSGKMCDEYAQKDSRITVYHKPNGGLSDARNFGVEHCNGELVSFIDSDDYVTEDYLEYLWYLMEKYSCKVSCAGNIQIFEGRSFSLKKNQITEIKLNTAKALERICYTSVSACARLYQKELLLKHPFPVGRLYEDMANTYKVIAECNYVVFSDKQIYIWVQRESSITHSGINEKLLDIFWAADHLNQFLSENFPSCKIAASVRCTMAVSAFLTRVFQRCNKEDEKKYFRIAKSFALPHLKNAIKDKDTPVRLKFACIAISCGYYPSRFVWKARERQRRATGNNSSLITNKER